MYNRVERQIGRLMDAFPRLRAAAKFAYQRMAYVTSGGWRDATRVNLHSGAILCNVADPAPPDGWSSTDSAFYGYFGVSPWTECGRFYLVHRLRSGASACEVFVLDLESGARQKVGETRTWNFQQGSMAQWLGGTNPPTLVYNAVSGKALGMRVLAIDGKERFIPWPVQAAHPAGTEALSLNYRRLWRLRPEYGYDVAVDNFHPDQPLAEDGLWRVRMGDGSATLLVSLENLVSFDKRPEMARAEHKVNHAIYSPQGSRLVFVHRWIGRKGKFSRLYCVNSDGTGLQLLLDHRMVSHYSWKDETNLLVWARNANQEDSYFLIDVLRGDQRPIGYGILDRFGDGHPSFSPDRKWIVTDSYPDKRRMRRLVLFDCERERMIEVGRFYSPWRFEGSARCDLHPRWSPDGRHISIDSAHTGARQSYTIDVSRLTCE